VKGDPIFCLDEGLTPAPLAATAARSLEKESPVEVQKNVDDLDDTDDDSSKAGVGEFTRKIADKTRRVSACSCRASWRKLVVVSSHKHKGKERA
jgi:hypothetical protein